MNCLVISDGDIRKMILKNVDLSLPITKICNQNPKFLKENLNNLYVEKLFKDNRFDIIPVVDEK